MIKELLEATGYEIEYSFRKPILGNNPGAHESNKTGAGLEFKTLDSVHNFPDLRRVDWLASRRSGASLPLVRIFEEQKAIQVIVVCDLTASMGFRGKINKMQETAKFVSALDYSVYRSGDHFGFIGYGEEILNDFVFPPIFSKNIGFEIGEILWKLEPRGKNSGGLLTALDYLPNNPSLIFLISDFHGNSDAMEKFLQNSTQHEIIAFILDDEQEYKFKKWGPVKILDPETNKESFLFMYPGLARKIKAKFHEKKEGVKNIFGDNQVSFLNLNKFDPEKINCLLRSL